jgi:hypothetical protein
MGVSQGVVTRMVTASSETEEGRRFSVEIDTGERTCHIHHRVRLRGSHRSLKSLEQVLS